MFLPIRTVFHEWEEENAGMPVTDAHENFIPVLHADGKPVAANEVLVYYDGSPLVDYDDLEKIHNQFTKREEEGETKSTNAISLNRIHIFLAYQNYRVLTHIYPHTLIEVKYRSCVTLI